MVNRALDLGVNYIDTARGYKDSEDRIGKAIAGRRDEVIIATKGGGRNRASALESLELSLKHLQMDYIDLWQIRGVNSLEDNDRVASENVYWHTV